MNFLSNILREEGGFEYKKAIVDSIVILIRDIPDAKESGLLHLCEFIEDCEFTYLSTQVALYSIIICCTISSNFHFFHN
jgi:coatomer protein complex subunit gamma